MNFKAIQDAVLVDAFAEGKRAEAIKWINSRYSWLCDLESWTFMQGTAAVTVTSGSQLVSNLPTDFGIAVGLIDQYGASLECLRDAAEFYSRYTNPSAPTTGQPEAYTVIGGSILVGPTANVTSTAFTLLYEKTAAALVNDSDTPIIPAGYHVALVHGGKAAGFRLTNIPLADQFDAEFRGHIDAMRAKYLTAMRDKQRQIPAYRP